MHRAGSCFFEFAVVFVVQGQDVKLRQKPADSLANMENIYILLNDFITVLTDAPRDGWYITHINNGVSDDNESRWWDVVTLSLSQRSMRSTTRVKDTDL